MDRSLLYSFLIVAVASTLAVSRASFAPQIYWYTKLPNSPMPSSIRELLKPAEVSKGSTGVNVQTDHKVKVGPNAGLLLIFYEHSNTSAEQHHDRPFVFYFFLLKDLRTGKKVSLSLFNSTTANAFLPRHVADSIPFSSAKSAEILSKLAIDPTSTDADAMKETLESCEKRVEQGEDRLCVTSLEAMVDFATTKLGKDVKAVTTAVGKDSKVMTYTVGPAGAQEMEGHNHLICHRLAYAYAVYYCHETYETRAYMVPLVREDGTKAEAAAVCHKDTSAWDPTHPALQMLKVKPGSEPVCHFLPHDHVVWVPSNEI